MWSIAASCLRKNKNRENSKVNTTFSRNFAPAKTSRYTVADILILQLHNQAGIRKAGRSLEMMLGYNYVGGLQS